MIFLYLIAGFVILAGVIYLGSLFFRWLDTWLAVEAKFDLFDWKMIGCCFLFLVFLTLGWMSQNGQQRYAGVCNAATGQWYGSGLAGQQYELYCVDQVRKGNWRNLTENQCMHTFVKCGGTIGEPHTFLIIFYYALAALTFGIPFVSALRHGPLGMIGFLSQLFFGGLIYMIMALLAILGFAAGKRETAIPAASVPPSMPHG